MKQVTIVTKVLILMLLLVFIISLLAVQAKKIDQEENIEQNSVKRITEPKILVLNKDVIAESLSPDYNIMTINYNGDTLNIVYEHFDVWAAFDPNRTPDENGEDHNARLGYYIPVRLIKDAKDPP